DAGLPFRIVCGQVHKRTYPPHRLGLLRPRGQWPRRRAPQQSDELSPPHSIPSSAMMGSEYQMISRSVAIAAPQSAWVATAEVGSGAELATRLLMPPSSSAPPPIPDIRVIDWTTYALC